MMTSRGDEWRQIQRRKHRRRRRKNWRCQCSGRCEWVNDGNL